MTNLLVVEREANAASRPSRAASGAPQSQLSAPLDQNLSLWVHCGWSTEEFFKALKTGCALETRQLETRHALLNVLALSMLIAWQLLLLRHLFRASPDAPATAALTPTQLRVLSVCGSIPLGPRPTVREALYAVARMGGHVRTNGDPGWLVLGRGMAKLRTLSIGWAARDALRVRNYAERSAPS
jgi:hypothetical protein